MGRLYAGEGPNVVVEEDKEEEEGRGRKCGSLPCGCKARITANMSPWYAHSKGLTSKAALEEARRGGKKNEKEKKKVFEPMDEM